MAIGSSLGITLPTQGGNSGTWGTDLNTELNKIITAVESLVPSTAIDFSTDLDVNSQAITKAAYVALENQTSVTALNSAYFKAGEFFIRDGANNEVQLSLSGSLNTSLVAGVGNSGGTYGTSGITFDWDGTRYNARNGSTTDDYASVRMDRLDLRDGSGNDLTVAAPSGMTGDYTLTLPGSTPASDATIVQSDSSGNLSFSNSFSQDITLTGSAKINFASKTISIPAGLATGIDSNTDLLQVLDGVWTIGVAGGDLQYPVSLPVGEVVDSVTVYYDGGTGVGTRTASIVEVDQGGNRTGLGSSNQATNGETTMVVTPSSTLTVAADKAYFIEVSGVTGDQFTHCTLTSNQP